MFFFFYCHVHKIFKIKFHSTVSTGLSALAAITLKDFIIGAFGYNLKDSKQAQLAKWISLFYGIVSFAIVFLVAQVGGVLQVIFLTKT